MTDPTPARPPAARPRLATKPLRILSLGLTDFRAFGGAAKTDLPLNGGNLFVYGENGAGKTSIFHALRGLFARRPGQSILNREKNVFSQEPETTVAVEVLFNDGGPAAVWNSTGHPGRAPGVDARVAATALRGAMLDYRALLDTNYLHGDRRPNLFKVAVDHLLADFPTSGGATLGALWDAVGRSKPSVYRQSNPYADKACTDFSVEMRAALDSLHPQAATILELLTGPDLQLEGFEFSGVTYRNEWQKRDRSFIGQELLLSLKDRTYGVTHPQIFLNEARLSALALSIYLGGRLACTPTATPEALKLLVLDDVLIGLDLSNRLPILDVLKEHFADWQVVLLTHDRVWFDMAKAHMRREKNWSYVEVLEPPEADGKTPPVVRTVNKNVAAELLMQAEQFLKQGHAPAAANYTRVAFEHAVREFCDAKAISVRYRVNAKELKLEELLNGLRTYIKDNGGDGGKYGAAIRALELYQQAVLNPLSHAGSPQVLKAEVRSAIAAVQTLVQATQVR